MRIVRVIKHRLRSLFQRSRLDFDLQREFEVHLEQLVKERMADGMSKSEAVLAANREFGPVSLAQEQCRDMRATNPGPNDRDAQPIGSGHAAARWRVMERA